MRMIGALTLESIARASRSRLRGPLAVAALTVALTVALSACGFRLQGSTPLPFKTLYMKVPENTAFGADLRRAIKASSPNTLLVEDASVPYEAALQQISETRNAREVSLNAQGRVEEYELTLTYTFSVVSAAGDVILPNTTLRAVRNLPFDDRVVQAKEVEEATLFSQMQTSLVSRIVRRVSAPDVAQSYEQLKARNQQ